MRDMIIDGKTVDIFKAKNAGAPLVILNQYARNNGAVCQKCRELGCPDFTLVEISGLDWNNELSPWQAPALGSDDSPFGGQADAYLGVLLEKILPAVRAELDGEPSALLLAGYSLAGLFALYAATKCDRFQAVASCSGSMWFPDFKETIMKCDAAALPDICYFSLGDREARTRNETLRTVEKDTEEIAAYLASNGKKTVFELNKGNHFQQNTLRIAKGIRWILGQTTKSAA